MKNNLMKNLKLAYNDFGHEGITEIPMYKWVVDWWNNCSVCPSNDAEILSVELDGEAVKVPNSAYKYPTFLDVADYFGWDGLHRDFLEEVPDGEDMFEDWLKNYTKKK